MMGKMVVIQYTDTKQTLLTLSNIYNDHKLHMVVIQYIVEKTIQ